MKYYKKYSKKINNNVLDNQQVSIKKEIKHKNIDIIKVLTLLSALWQSTLFILIILIFDFIPIIIFAPLIALTWIGRSKSIKKSKEWISYSLIQAILSIDIIGIIAYMISIIKYS